MSDMLLESYNILWIQRYKYVNKIILIYNKQFLVILEQTVPGTGLLCPGDELILTCKTIGTGFLTWAVPDSQVSPVTFLNTTNIISLENYPISFQNFILTFVSGNQTTVCSQATLNTPVTPLVNGDSISCSDAISQPVTSTIIVTGEIQIIRLQ